MDCPKLAELIEKKTDKKRIGKGQQGSVYKIDDHVLKIVDFPENEQRKQRFIALFKKEKDALETLSEKEETKDYLPPLCYVEYDDKHGYIVQKYEKVTTLKDFLKNMKDGKKTWRLDVSIPFIENLHKGVEAIHKAGYLHRDLKPENILIRFDKLTTPSIIDFGLACKMKEDGTCDPDVLGTFEFIPTNFIPLKTMRAKQTQKIRTATGIKSVQTSKNILNQFFSKDTDKYALALIMDEILPIMSWKHKPHHEKMAAELTPDVLDSLKKKLAFDNQVQQLKGKVVSTLAAQRGKTVLNTTIRKSLFRSIAKEAAAKAATQTHGGKRRTQKKRRASR